MVAFTVKKHDFPWVQIFGFSSLRAFQYICLPLLCSFGPFLGCLKGFLSYFCVRESFLPLKIGKKFKFVFLCFWALKIGFLGLKRYQNDRNIGPAAWRY